MGIKILGTGRFFPEQSVTNDDLTKYADTSDEWIKTRTGISSRFISGWEPAWYLGAGAAKAAIKKAGIDPSEIGLIITPTITSNFHFPAAANIIQNAIGAVNAFSFDISAACSGFIFGLDMAGRYLETDRSIKYALVIAAETLSRITDFSDRNTSILFGDGSGAALITRSDDPYYSYLYSDGSGSKYLYAYSIMTNDAFAVKKEHITDFPAAPAHTIVQDGKEVYKFAVKALPKAVKEVTQKAGISIHDIDCIIPHQANIRILDTAAKNLGVSMDKFAVSIGHCGNTSSASIPIALDEAVETGRVKKGDLVCLAGFGAGLTVGAALFRM